MLPQANTLLKVKLPAVIAFQLTQDALRETNSSIEMADIVTGRIIAKKGFSFWSAGEKIHIEFKELAPSITAVAIVSFSALSTTRIDWGKNAKNIKEFEEVFLKIVNNYVMRTR